jgi:hypothetical protein
MFAGGVPPWNLSRGTAKRRDHRGASVPRTKYASELLVVRIPSPWTNGPSRDHGPGSPPVEDSHGHAHWRQTSLGPVCDHGESPSPARIRMMSQPRHPPEGLASGPEADPNPPPLRRRGCVSLSGRSNIPAQAFAVPLYIMWISTWAHSSWPGDACHSARIPIANRRGGRAGWGLVRSFSQAGLASFTFEIHDRPRFQQRDTRPCAHKAGDQMDSRVRGTWRSSDA